MRNEFKLGQLVYYSDCGMAQPYTVTATPDMLASDYLMEIKPAWPGSAGQYLVPTLCVLVYDNYADCQDYAVTQMEDALAGAKFMARAMKNDGLQYLTTEAGSSLVPRAEAERMISEYLERQNA